MDILAFILMLLSAVVAFGSSRPPATGTARSWFWTLGVAVGLMALAFVCQDVNLTGVHVHVDHSG